MELPRGAEALLLAAAQHLTEEDFKTKDLGRYLLAKKKRLLKIAFPVVKVEVTTLHGIYFLYNHNRIVYIDHSLDCENDIKAFALAKDMTFNNYKIFPMHSSSDIIVLAVYLANKFKPQYNLNIGITTLSFKITNYPTLLGEAIRGTVADLIATL